jgi:hypothetical protein
MKLHYNPFQIFVAAKRLPGFMPDKNAWKKQAV